jgi:UDP-4-amino-4,6-dideoxy-N-acetyl-beta-L-altrosamine transaminase
MAGSRSAGQPHRQKGGMSGPKPFLPYARQTIEEDDVATVAAALRSEWLTTGPRVEEFERAFANATGAAYAVVCNSGTAALHLAALAIDLKPHRAAIVPTLTFLATANAVRMTGAEVVFADVDGETGLMTAQTLRLALDQAIRGGQRVVAAFAVHLNGQLCNLAALAEVAQEYGITLVEDACHALGVPEVGASPYSRLACFSTHAVKAIATGEGGVITTNDPGLAERMRQLRSHGITREPTNFASIGDAFDDAVPNPWYYEMGEVGFNYRLPDILCALGISQLGKLPRFYRRRQEIARRYDGLLAPLSPVVRAVPHGVRPHGWHLYAILVDFAAIGTSRRQFMERLRAAGIGTQVHYIPVHQQPYYRQRYGELPLAGAEAYYARCLSIPFYPALSDANVERVAARLRATVAGSA